MIRFDILNNNYDYDFSEDEFDDNKNNTSLLDLDCSNSNLISNELQKMDSKITEAESKNFLEKKTEREKSESDEFLEKNEYEEEKENTKTKGVIDIRAKGRKKKGAKPKKGAHDKFVEDNLVRKLKTFTFQYILEKLNISFKEIKPQNKFYRLDKSLNQNIKKDFNENLLQSKLKDIYKYPHSNNKYKKRDQHNRELIEKIYEEKIEIEVINILEKTFRDILNDIKERDLEAFLGEIRKKELKNNNGENVEKYIEAIKNMLFYFEKWFSLKRGRKAKNNKNHNICLYNSDNNYDYNFSGNEHNDIQNNNPLLDLDYEEGFNKQYSLICFEDIISEKNDYYDKLYKGNNSFQMKF